MYAGACRITSAAGREGTFHAMPFLNYQKDSTSRLWIGWAKNSQQMARPWGPEKGRNQARRGMGAKFSMPAV